MKKLSLVLVLFAVSLYGQQKINPVKGIEWPVSTANGAPTATCNSLNYGQPYTNLTNGDFYICTTSGWLVKGSGGGGTPGGANLQLQYNNNGAFGGTSATVDALGNLTGKSYSISAVGGQVAGLPLIYADSSLFSGVRLIQPTTGVLINRKGSYNSAEFLGDSITDGFSSGGPSAKNCTVPFDGSQTCYIAYITYGMGIAGNAVIKEAVSGDTTPDLGYRFWNASTGPANNKLTTMMIGTNDMAGVARNFSPATLAIEPDLIQQWMALEEYLSIDPTNWYEATGSTCSGAGGGWTDDTNYGTHPGCQSHTNGDILTFPCWTSVTGGEPVAVFLRYFQPSVGNGGTYQVNIGESTTGCGGTFTPMASATFNTTSTSQALNFVNVGGQTSTVFSAILSNSSSTIGPGTGIANSGFVPTLNRSYSVTVKVLSASSSSNIVSVIGMGTGMGWNCASCNINQITWPSQAWIFDIPNTKGGNQWGILPQLNSDKDSAILSDQQSGFSVVKISTHNCLKGESPEFDPTNPHHPLVLGHQEMAACALYFQTTKVAAPTSSATPSAINSSGGLMVGTVSLGNSGSSMQFNDNSGQVVFKPRSGFTGTGQLLQFDSMLTPTYATLGATQTFSGPGIGGLGHYLDESVAWYDIATGHKFVEYWRQTWASNSSSTVTPTAFIRTSNCTMYDTTTDPTKLSPLTCTVPLQFVWTPPASVNNTVTWNNTKWFLNPSSAYASLNIGSIAGNPTNRVANDLWFDSTNSNHLTTYQSATNQVFAYMSDIPTNPLSGMTAGQVAIAATATTVTSSKAIAGSGAGLTTGPTSGVTSGNCANFTGTGGQIADSGTTCGGGAVTASTNWVLRSNGASAITLSGAGGIRGWGFTVPTPVTFSNIYLQSSTADATTQNGAAIANSSGTILCHTSTGLAVPTAAALWTIPCAEGSVTINPGITYILLTSSAATTANIKTATANQEIGPYYNSSVTGCTGTSGVITGTCSITPAVAVYAGGFPNAFLH